MRVLMFSSDQTITDPTSNAAQRMIDYGKLVNELDIFVLARSRGASNSLSKQTSVQVFSGRWTRFLKAFIDGLKELRRRKYNLIVAQDVEHAGILWVLSLLTGVPWQMQIHSDILSPFFWRQSFTNKLRVIFARFLTPRASCIRVVSQRIKNSLISKFNIPASKITTLPIFVDFQKIENLPIGTDLHKKYSGYKKIILMASRITKEKNISLAIEALRGAVQKHPQTLLLIVGDGPEGESLKLKVKSLDLEHNVRFEPRTNDLISYYKTADLFLLTSNYEGYGMTLVEAATAGCPIVSTDVGIAFEIKGARVVPVGDAAALRQAIEDQIINPKRPIAPAVGTYEEYLERYRNSWQRCTS